MSKRAIEPDSPTPIRSQLKDILMAELAAGRFQRGGRFPSERELADQYQISRASVRETITEMINSGMLFRTVGKGTFVTSETPAVRQNRVRNLAFVISDNIFQFVQTGYNKILGGVQDVCRERGCSVLFHSIGEDLGNRSLVAISDDEGRVDGCVVVGGVRQHTLDYLDEQGIPTVLVDLLIAEESGAAATVTIDYARGAHLAVEHLHQLGHQNIGYLGFSGSEKYRGYWQSLEALGLRYDPRHVQFLHLLDLQPGILAGYQAMQRMIAGGRLPSALLVTNDFVALGVVEALGVAGIRVPEQISIVGFDDLGQKASPPLTTVRVDLNEVGRLAACALFRRIAGESLELENLVVPVDLVVRGSTGPIAGEALTA